RYLLPVALGVGARLLGRVEVEPLDQLLAALALALPGGRASPAEPDEQVDDLAAGHRRPERAVAGHVREPAVQGGRVPPGIAAEQGNIAAVLAEQAEQDADRGGLARAVRAEEGVHLAGL